MNRLTLSSLQVAAEIERIVNFLRSHLGDSRHAVLGISGGIDSDVTARLAVKAIGAGRLKFFTVVQAEMEDHHLRNARQVATDLGVPLVEVPLVGWAGGLMEVLAKSDPLESFSNEAFIDIGRIKNALRCVIYSSYHIRGYITLGTSNRTEVECGFFGSLADDIWHLGPLAHLYKTQVYQLAKALGSRPETISQPASAGYWRGQSDLEDLAFWLVNEAPIGAQRAFAPDEVALAQAIHAELSFERLDLALAMIAEGYAEAATIAQASGLTTPTAERLRRLVAAASRIKSFPLGRQIASDGVFQSGLPKMPRSDPNPTHLAGVDMTMQTSLLLRPPRYYDVASYTAYMADPQVTLWLDDRCQRPVLFHHAQAFVLGEAWCRLAIEYEGRFVGMAGLEDYDLANGAARFFVVVGDRSAWNKGVGTATLRRILELGFKDLGLRRIVSNYLAPNHASRIVHERAGFVVEGHQRQIVWRAGAWVDQILVSMLRDEWIERNANQPSAGIPAA